MSAILFGSISTVADTSEMQREAFGTASWAHGLDWSWSREEYRPLLQSSAGEQRVADYAAVRGEDVDAGAVHRIKSELAQGRMTAGVTARPGVVDNVIGLASAKAAGVRTIAFPNANTADRDFDAADQRVDRLDPDALISAA